MSKVNAWADANDLIVGHLKGFAEPCGGSVTLSTTGGAVSEAGAFTIDVGVTGILFGAELAEVEDKIGLLAVNALTALGVSNAHVEKCGEEHGHEHEHHHGHTHG
jgi:hypothetical protein